MFLSDFSIRRPVATIVFIISLMCLGLMALKDLRVNRSPDVEQPFLSINIPYPGASPETVEREVINRIEKSLQSITGVDQINSTASEGNANIFIRFTFKKNMIEASEEVRNAIASVRYKLPNEMREPIMQRVDASAQPVMQLALSSSSQSHADISRLAEDELAEKFRGVDGVAQVTVNGALRRELSVLLRAEKLREFNVSVSDVVNALRTQNATAPVGKVKGSLEEQSIRLIGRLESPAEFEQIVIRRNPAGEVVRLGQVANVADGFAELSSMSLRNGHPNVNLSLIRAREASTVSVTAKARKLIEEINKTLPKGTTLEVTDDGGEVAQKSLNNVIESLVLGAGLTVFVVYLFLNSWRSTLITALSLPTSVIAAFIAIWLCGFTLNFMTLLGLSLAIGVLIDDAIVVRENIVRHLGMGKDRITAASEGTREIGLAVAATTFSIVSVFIPVAFMPGITGEWFRPFALTVASSVMVSLLISFTLDPMLSAYWGDPPNYHASKKKGLGGLLDRFNHWFDHQANRYQHMIAWALRHRRLMAAIAASSFVGAIYLHMQYGGSSFFPASDGGALMIEVRTPSGANLEYARLKVEKAAEVARKLPETLATNSLVRPGGGRVYVDLGESSKRKRRALEVAKELRTSLQSLIGAEFVVLDDFNNGARKPVQLQFYGPDSRKLLEITSKFMEKMREIKGAVDVGLSEQAPKDELQIEIARGLANSLGISAGDAAQSLRVAFAGVEVGDWVDPGGETRDVAVRLHPQDRVSLENIERLPIAAGNGVVPLNQIAHISMGKGPSQIQHTDGKRMISVGANVEGRSAGEVTKDAIKLARSFNYPPGYGHELGGASKGQQDVFSAMGNALLMGVGMMYLILVMQFGSFTAPISVMLSLSLSMIGVVIALLVTNSTLNMMSMIGIVMLMGLVAKNAILLLDCARKQQAEGMERSQALLNAGRLRLRPILMTTFALIAGMLPVAIGAGEGGDFYRPLAIAIIGGTITSTILTLLVVPTFYDSIEDASQRAKAKYTSRSTRMASALAFMLTLLEAMLTLLMLRFVWRKLLALPRLLLRRKLA